MYVQHACSIQVALLTSHPCGQAQTSKVASAAFLGYSSRDCVVETFSMSIASIGHFRKRNMSRQSREDFRTLFWSGLGHKWCRVHDPGKQETFHSVFIYCFGNMFPHWWNWLALQRRRGQKHLLHESLLVTTIMCFIISTLDLFSLNLPGLSRRPFHLVESSFSPVYHQLATSLNISRIS